MARFWLSLALGYCSCLPLFSQERSVYGKIIDQNNRSGIGDLQLINKRTKALANTNVNGDFYFRTLPGDSILILSFGYQRAGFAVIENQKNYELKVKRQPVMLREVTVREKSLAEAQEEIKKLLRNPQNAATLKQELLNSLPQNTNSGGSGIGISIDALYDLYSKEGKAARKLADLKYYQKLKSFSEYIYNPQSIQKVTGLTEEDVQEYINFCKIPEEFVLNATTYELTFRMLQCAKRFRISKIIR